MEIYCIADNELVHILTLCNQNIAELPIIPFGGSCMLKDYRYG